MRIKLQAWTPDTVGDPEDYSGPTQQDTKNVYPAASGYAPVKALAKLSTNALSSKCLGATPAVFSTGLKTFFAGTASKLYELLSVTLTDVSKVGGYNCTDRWEFIQFGLRVIAINSGDNPQYFDVGTSTLFADLAGSPPKAAHIAGIRDFVVLGNTSNSIMEVFWSGFNNSEQWTQGTNQCDSQTLPDGGAIQAITGGEVGYVFQEHAIRRMSYVGPPLIFQFDVVQTNRGVDAPGSVIDVGSQIYFHDHDGFYALEKATGAVTPIGFGKVDKWFSDHAAPDDSTLVSSAFDPKKKLIIWSFVSNDAVDATHPDTVLFYHYVRNEFSYAKFDHDLIFTSLTNSLTLDSNLDTYYTTLEAIPVSLDSQIWVGGAAYAAVFSSDHFLAALEGDTLAASFGTAYFEGVPGRRSMITNVRPFTDTSAMLATLTSYERLADTTSTATSVTDAMQSNGDIPILSSGHYHMLTLTIPAATIWTFATGADVDAADDGVI